MKMLCLPEAGTIALFLGGLFGSWLRAKGSTTQETWSYKTLSDILVGGGFSTVLPYLAGVSGFLDWKGMHPFVLFVFSMSLSISITWASTAIQWARRGNLLGEEPGVKNAAPLLQPAASKEEKQQQEKQEKQQNGRS